MSHQQPPNWQPQPNWQQPPQGWGGQQQAWPPQPPKKQKSNSKVGLIVLGIIAIIIGLGALGSCGSGDDEASGGSSATTAAYSAAPQITRSPEDEARIRAEASAAAATSASVAAAASRAIADEKARQTDPANYPAISAREFALLAKDPAAHVGEKYTIYGRVTQADSATGKAIRVSTGSDQGGPYDYDVNSVVEGEPEVLGPVVKDDLVTMFVRVNGAKSYTTTLGGNVTAPEFEAYVIEVTGSA